MIATGRRAERLLPLVEAFGADTVHATAFDIRDAAAMEAFGLGCIPGLHLLLRVLKTVKIVGVQHREIEILSTNNHVWLLSVEPCPGSAPEK